MEFIIKSIMYTIVAAILYALGFPPQEKNFWIIIFMLMVLDMLFVGSITARLRSRGKKAGPVHETAEETTGQG